MTPPSDHPASSAPGRRVGTEVHLGPHDLRRALEADVRAGLTSTPKRMPPVWFYDERGSQLFDDITRLPEYYPTDCERSILEKHANEIIELSGATTLIELGSGTSEKTRLLLDALTAGHDAPTFAPLDVSEATLRAAVDELAAAYPSLSISAVVGDFHRHLGALPRQGRRLVAFLGGTIGNLEPASRARFLFDLDCALGAGDSLLLGTDLVKATDRLVAAYDDAQGVTAEFNRNLLHVLNRELGGDFDAGAFVHVARWNGTERWIEMRLRASESCRVRLADLDLTVAFEAGEELLTEISAKFTAEQVRDELWTAGFEVVASFTDDGGDFLLTLARPTC